MSFDPESVTPPGAKIKVIGVGGGGGNAVNTMIRSQLDGVDFIAANTDVQALRFSLAPNKVQMGKELTRGLGAGADPDIGRDAALEDRHEIQDLLAGADMVFITAGMGGGTGTGGASVVAQIARELGALTVAVVTKPFGFEGKRRRKHAEVGITRLRECVDTLITIPNQRLLQVASPSLTMIDAFKMADEVLVNAVRGISDIINIPGTVNVDFADVKTVMSCMGQALMGIGAATGERRAVEAARMAISSPLLEDVDIEGATGILINITAGSDVTLIEVNEACSVIQEAAHEDANIIFGAVIDETLGGQMRVTVIATGFPVDKDETEGLEPGRITVPTLTPLGVRLTTPTLTSARPAVRPELRREPVAPAYRPAGPVPRPEPRAEAPDEMSQMGASRADDSAAAMAAAEPRRAPLLDDQSRARAAAAVAPEDTAGLGPDSHGETDPPPRANPREEAQELAHWTLDASEVGFGEDIPSLAPEAPALPEAAAGHREGARAFATSATPNAAATMAERLFAGDGAAEEEAESDAFLLAEPPPAAPAEGEDEHGAHAAADLRAGAVREQAPLETFFSPPGGLLGSDIDRKIDEALELAERLRQPRRTAEADDLDVPAFLRNGMKDLPLD